ncbi:MAG: hypothetical protein WBI31_01970 [Thermacetogeniaceae bacterium]
MNIWLLEYQWWHLIFLCGEKLSAISVMGWWSTLLIPQAIADAVQWLLAHPAEAELMDKRGQDAVIKKYN